MPTLPVYQVDAFTRTAFAGNPAAVCPLASPLDDATMASIAREMNLSETAFFVPRGRDFDLRWFTPEVEVDLCGHATLASAFVLLTELEPARREVTFHTRSGPLGVTRDGDRFVLDLPSRPPTAVVEGAGSLAAALEDALGARPREVVRARDLVAIYDDPDVVRALRPDMAKVLALGAYAVCATAPGGGARDGDVDFVSRFFAPGGGIPEDPVTGSAHCTLAPLWAARLGRSELSARQVSARGGELSCEVRGERVRLGGHAVLVMRGTLLV